MRIQRLPGTSCVSLAPLVAFVAGCSGGVNHGPIGSTSSAVTEKCGQPANGPVQGVDVSEYQGNFDWPAAHVAFGYAQISDGVGHLDPTFPGNWANMKAAGVLRGAYQYFEPSEDEAAQANLMVSMVGRLQAGDLPPMIDVEVTDGVGGSTIGARVLHWLQIVEAGTGRTPIIYTGSYFWEDDVGVNLGSYPIWIAAYGPPCPSLPQDGWSNWTFWQYGDGGGTLDHDVFNGSLAQLQSMAGVAEGPPTPKPPAPTGCGAIAAGQGLSAGESVTSCDGRFDFVMQTDGNLVLYMGPTALWSSGTNGTDGEVAIMQGDGNFVVYGSHSDPLWASNTGGHPGSSLAVQDDGNVVVYEPGGHPGWTSGTNLPAAPAAPTACGVFQAGQGLVAGQSHASCDGRFELAMQTDGNLVLYEGAQALWATATNGKLGYSMVMQGDGNFVVYDTHSEPLWWSGTSGHSGSYLAEQTDGNLVVYEPGGHPGWASNTAGH